MKTLIVYDSVHGNTEKIAKAIAAAIPGETKVFRAGELEASQLTGADLLIVGSPTYGGRPTEAMQQLLARLPSSTVKGVKVATFDTRLPSRFVRVFGFAADKIADDLRSKGANVFVPPEGFFVGGREGPLKDGEEARAASWTRQLTR